MTSMAGRRIAGSPLQIFASISVRRSVFDQSNTIASICTRRSGFSLLNTTRSASTTAQPASNDNVNTTSNARRPKKGRQAANLLPRREKPDSKVLALCTADAYNMLSLQKALKNYDLIDTGKERDALNIYGEAIYLPRWYDGEIFIFENGSAVMWNVNDQGVNDFAKGLLGAQGVQMGAYDKATEEESVYYTLQQQGGPTYVKGDTIFIQANTSRELQIEDDSDFRIPPLPAPGKLPTVADAALPAPHVSGLPMTKDSIVARFAVSSALMRSTKLAVFENQLEELIKQEAQTVRILQKQPTSLPKEKSMIKTAGKLLHIRQEINLSDSNLLDPPNFLWETGTKVEKLYESVDHLMDFAERLRTLNQKIDYAENANEKLLQLRATSTSHRLEWIIIVLIAIEVVYNYLKDDCPPILRHPIDYLWPSARNSYEGGPLSTKSTLMEEDSVVPLTEEQPIAVVASKEPRGS